MELIDKNMDNLFAQLGEANSVTDIATFIERHAPIAGEVMLHEATFWTQSQSHFLREATDMDAAWAPVVDELNARLHWPSGF